jgi:hypothetical protein
MCQSIYPLPHIKGNTVEIIEKSFSKFSYSCKVERAIGYRVTRSWQVGGDFASKAAQTYIII